MQHHFNVEIAKTFGVNIAIFLDHMAFWIQKNIGNNKHFYDGAYWTRNEVKAYLVIFPYLSAKQMRKVITDCEKYGLINIGNYNDTKYDRTHWYSLTEYSAKLLNISIFPSGQIEVPKKTNRSSQKGTPIPCTNTGTNTRESTPHKKRSALPKDFEPNEEAKALAKNKNIDLDRTLSKFKHHANSDGWTRFDWQEAFMKWVIDEKPEQKTYFSNNIRKIDEPIRPKMRDFTQERLDREKEQRQSI